MKKTVCEKGGKGCGPNRCVQCEKMMRERKRARILNTVIKTTLSWCCLAVTVLVLGIIAQLFNADMAIMVAGGAMGVCWYHVFIDSHPHGYGKNNSNFNGIIHL